MNPKEIKIGNKEWWVKPIEMLVHNWALIEENSKLDLNFLKQLSKEPCLTIWFWVATAKMITTPQKYLMTVLILRKCQDLAKFLNL